MTREELLERKAYWLEQLHIAFGHLQELDFWLTQETKPSELPPQPAEPTDKK